MGSKQINLIGQTFNRLTVLKQETELQLKKKSTSQNQELKCTKQRNLNFQNKEFTIQKQGIEFSEQEVKLHCEHGI